MIERLGIRAGHQIAIVAAPEGYIESLRLPPGVILSELETGKLDIIQFFASSRAMLNVFMPELKEALATDGMLWLSWPKAGSGVPTDLNENAVIETGLRFGLVDVKVTAIDEVWSALKFVYRVKDRVTNR